MNKSNAKTNLEWVEYYAKQKPGAGAHEVPRFPAVLPTQRHSGSSTWSRPRHDPRALR